MNNPDDKQVESRIPSVLNIVITPQGVRTTLSDEDGEVLYRTVEEMGPNESPYVLRSSFETDFGSPELSDDEIDVLDAISKLHRAKSVGYHFEAGETDKLIGRRLVFETGELRSDEDGHWFAVPDSKLEEFDDRMEAIEGKDYMECPEQVDDFIDFSGEFSIDRPCDVKVVISRDEVVG